MVKGIKVEASMERNASLLASSHNTTLLSVTPPFQLDMESAINVLVTQFKTYAAKDGSSNTLSKDEFQSLVASQLPNLVKNASDPDVINQLMSCLDENNDGELTFQEFWKLIGKLACTHGGFSQ